MEALQDEVEMLRQQVISMGGTPMEREPAPAAARKKGVAICSEQIETEDFVAPNFPKGAGTRVLIEGAMSASSMFNNLSKEQCEAVIGAMYPAQRAGGEPIIVQGEPAQNYFVVDVGKCDVFVQRHVGRSSAEELVLTIGSGASFGEIALMYECENNITIKAHVDVTVWTIDRRTFRSIVVNSTSKKRRQYESILASVELFESLSKAERALMADALEDVVFEDGDTIMKQGAEGDYFYIINKGKASVLVDTEQVALRGDGEYIGEKALLANEPRMASCVAVGEVECARMDRDTFTRILGPLGEILKFREYDADGKEIMKAGGAAEDEASVESAPASLHYEFAEAPGQENLAMHRDMFDKGPTLGIGAFGYVQLVHYKQTGKVYALKTLTKKSILKTDQFVHCRDEIANLRAATNPFIVNLFSCFQDGMTRLTHIAHYRRLLCFCALVNLTNLVVCLLVHS